MLTVLLLNKMSMKRRSLRMSRQNIRKGQEVNYCRTCLSTQDLVPIFPNKEMHLKRTEDLKLVTGLEIKYNDGLSQKICTECIERMNMALQFRRKSKKAEKALLGLALGTKIKKKYSSKTLGVKKKPRIQKRKPCEVEIDSFNYQDKKVPIGDYNFGNIPDDGADNWQNDDFHVDVKNDDYDDFAEKSEDMEPKIRGYSKKPLPRQVKKRLAIPNATNYKCNICSKEFRMKATYKAHLRFHTNYCVCESCGKRCRNNNQLQEHKRARHGLGRIHKCAYCEYSSATKEALTIHERRHTGERPYICDHCGASFHRRSNLVQHIAIHLPEKNFQCDMCPKRLKSRKFLQIHKHNAHTGKRYGYLCSICAHRFEKPNKVRAHTRRVHGLPDDQQAPVCSICSKFEKSRKLLQVHIFKVHREKRYKYLCPICQDVFSRPYNVRLHLARTHGVSKANQTSVIHRIETPNL